MQNYFSPQDMESLVRAYSTMDLDQLNTVKEQVADLNSDNPALHIRHSFLSALINNLIEWRAKDAPWIPNIHVK